MTFVRFGGFARLVCVRWIRVMQPSCIGSELTIRQRKEVHQPVPVDHVAGRTTGAGLG